MKKALLSLVAVGLMAASANAATLSLQWQGATGNKISLAPSDTAVIDVVVQLAAPDTLSGVFFQFEPLPFVAHQSDSTNVAGWQATNTGTGLAFGPSQFVVEATPGNNLAGAQTLVVGSILLHLGDNGDPLGTEYEVAIDQINQNVGVVDAAGTLMTFGPAFADFGGFYDVATGAGGRDAGAPFGASPRDPLLITLVPEPGTIALLAIGGFGVVMRRRRS